MNSGVAHFAHLGGMVGGLLMIRYWRGQLPFGRDSVSRKRGKTLRGRGRRPLAHAGENSRGVRQP